MKGGIGTGESELTKRLREGDEGALEELIGLYTPMVSRVIAWKLSRTGDAAETEALVSDVFLALWRSRAKLRDEGIASYLIAIARNRAGSYLRKKRREIPVDPADMTETPDNGELPEDAAERKLLAESLLEALDEETRKLFVRHYYFGQTVEEASRELGMNLSTAKSRLVRGREKLNRLLEGENKRERRREKRHGNAF